jgi:acetyl-CoA synthetase
MADEKKSITSMLDEKRRFSPVPEFVEKAHIKSLDEYAVMAKKAEEDFEGFWSHLVQEVGQRSRGRDARCEVVHGRQAQYRI